MALRDVLSRFRSISRPSLLSGTSGTYSSLAKKTLAAEDAIIDNQYANGDLSAEYYLGKLRERSVRGTLTPLQRVSLSQKMVDVQVAVDDADVSRRYASGELTTKDVLGYEKGKLDNMTEPTSAAYIKQQQKVQGLQDKSEREDRTRFRVAENLRISRLPEDTSANMWEKARLYQTLSDQARLDGDVQQADQLLTQANNYINSAKKADVNDLITGARLSVSQTPGSGLGLPSAEAGADILSQITGGQPIGSGSTAVRGSQGTAPGSAPSAVTATTGYSGFQSPAVKNALESLSRQEKTYQRLTAQRSDKETLIQRYKEAVNAATGDQKTSLQISLNNLIDDLSSIDNQLGNTTQNIQDTVERIQELKQKAALSTFKQEVRVNNSNFDKAETELETAFKKGKISKNEYIQKGVSLAEIKTQYLGQASEVFGQYGDDSAADNYLKKYDDTQQIHESLVSVANNIDDYEPIAVEPGGKITNLFGKKMQPGEVALTDVRNLKDSGVFQRQYAAKEGKFYKVHFPSDITDSNGDLLPAYVNEDLSKYNDKSFIYQVDQNGKLIGKDNPGSQIKFATINDVQRPFTSDLFNKMQKIGSIVQDKGGSWIQTPDPKGVNPLITLLAKVQGAVADPFVKALKGMNIFNPPTVGGASLVKDSIPSDVGDVIDRVAEKFKPGDLEFKKTLHAIALAESGGDPNAEGDNGDSIGLFQNKMHGGRGQGYTKEQLKDPTFNTELAAKELVKYYDQASKRGLTGQKAVAYVSKYGQRPAAGLEKNAAAKYGQLVSGAIAGVKSLFSSTKSSPVVQAKDYTTDQLPDPKKVRNIELALGLKPGQYRTGLRQDQAAVDRGFRSDKATQDLLRSEGLKPSWEAQSVSSTPTSQPIASVAPKQTSQPSQNVFQSVASGIGNAARSVSSGVQNAVSNIKLPQISLPKISLPTYQPKLLSPIPEPKQPNIIQKAVSTIKSNPVVQTVSNAVKNVVSSISNLFKRR